MTTMQAVKLAAAKLEKMTGDEGTNDGEHEAALELLGALGTFFAEQGRKERKAARVSAYLAERFPGTAQGDALERAERTLPRALPGQEPVVTPMAGGMLALRLTQEQADAVMLHLGATSGDLNNAHAKRLFRVYQALWAHFKGDR
jgi:hypothetical protein